MELEGYSPLFVRSVYLCLFSPWWIPCVCFCVPWHCYNLGNYSANKLGAMPNTESFFVGLIDSLDVLRLRSISVHDFWLCNDVVTSIVQKTKTAHLKQRASCCVKRKEGQYRDSFESALKGIKASGNTREMIAEPVSLLCTGLLFVGRHPISCHAISDLM